jgi:hypothetical protein
MAVLTAPALLMGLVCLHRQGPDPDRLSGGALAA